MNTATAVRQPDTGWSAELHLGFRARPGRTVLAERRRLGPLAVQRPFYPEGEVCHVYVLHPPGGVVGGDRLQIDADLTAGSQALVTTPGATKFYRSEAAIACQVQTLRIADGAALEWLPQENILFTGAQVAMQTRVELSGTARLALWEVHCLGRPANGESFDSGRLDAGLQIWRDGRPLLLERLRVDAASRLRPSLLNGHPVVATAVFTRADESHLRQLRTLIDGQPAAAATLVEDLLVLRYLGGSTEDVRRLYSAARRLLRAALLQRPAVEPRIWNT